jgi:peptide-methionine (R)-S-oxide reductase
MEMERREIIQLSFGLLGTGWLVRELWQQNRFNDAMAEPNSQEKPSQEKPMTTQITKTDAEWQAQLDGEQYRVLRKHGTERAGTSPLDKQYSPGTYYCAGCEQALFASDTKFNSGTGWPSFYLPLEGAIATTTDKSLFMTRVEVHCSRCEGHLGHVFNDGPKPTGLRYCMNGVSMRFEPKSA